MVAITGAVIETLIICILFYLTLHVLDKDGIYGFERKGKWICSGLVYAVSGGTAIAWLVISLNRDGMFAIPVQLLTVCVVWALAVLTVTDWKKNTIPNQFLFALIIIWGTIIGLYMILDIVSGMALLFMSLAGGIVGGMIFLLCYIISRKQLGAGDVKLVFVLGLFLTSQRIMGAIFYGVILCCVFSLIQLCRKKIGMKDGVPLVPFLYLGTLFTLFIL